MGIKTSTTILLLICSFLNLIFHGFSQDDDLASGASFIFGDSLVDAGNNNYLQTLSRANTTPNGIDFRASGGNPTGRFTNGRTIADIVGEELGQVSYATPYLAPNCTGRVILHGVNYASGGGGIMNETGQIFVNRLSLPIQVDYFNITRRKINELLGSSKARDYLMKKTIFSITIGSNDFLNNYVLPLVGTSTRISNSPDSFIDGMINNLRTQLTRLYQLDARKFIVSNIGPIGCIPYQRTINQLKENECVDLPDKFALQYNSRLRDLLTELNENLEGATFVQADVYSIVMELITNYKKYGFTSSSKACCGTGGEFAGIIPCGPASSICEDRNGHVFWDNYHPSEAANVIIAKQLLDGGPKYVTPINIRQLNDL